MREREPILGPNGWKAIVFVTLWLGGSYLYYDVYNAPEPAKYADDPFCMQQYSNARERACTEWWDANAPGPEDDPLLLRQSGRQ